MGESNEEEAHMSECERGEGGNRKDRERGGRECM